MNPIIESYVLVDKLGKKLKATIKRKVRSW